MKVLSTDGLTKLIQLIKSAFISVDDTVTTTTVALADVATSGSYNDLSDKPTIPAAQVNSDWNATSGKAEILNKPNLATVATSGSYNDLTNKPTIPTVNDATLTIQQNGTDVQTFSANASSNVTANITVPTKTSDLTNDSGYLDGSDFKTINNTNIVGSGNIDLPNMDNTTFRMYTGAKYYWYNNSSTLTWYAYTTSDTPSIGARVVVYDSRDTSQTQTYIATVSSVSSNSITISSNVAVINELTFYRNSTLDESGYYKLVDDEDTELEIKSSYLADTTLSNISSIDSNSAVQTALDGKVAKAGDTMSGRLTFDTDANDDYEAIYIQNSNIEQNVRPATNLFERIRFVDKNENYRAAVFYRHGSSGDVSIRLNVASLDGTDGLTTSMGYDASGNPYFNFPNSKGIDGQFVASTSTLKNSVSWTGAGGQAMSLSSYLPNDGQTYAVWVYGQVQTTATSGKFCRVGLNSDIQGYTTVCCAVARSNASYWAEGCAVMIVGSGRYLQQYTTTSANAGGTITVVAIGYRRLGTNS